jgi:dipeptidyl aminopeptidase/acylaminoacyl peptidase
VPGSRTPITPALVAATRTIAEPRWSPSGRWLAWAEASAGRTDLLLAPADLSTPARVVNPGELQCTSVGAYGGGVFCWSGDDTLIVVGEDGTLVALDVVSGSTVVLSDSGTASAPTAADGTVWFALENDADMCIASVPSDATSGARAVSAPVDFAWDPARSPGGALAWMEWDLPGMPWAGSRIQLDGATIAGGEGQSVGQPRFSPDGSQLAYVSDARGFWNVHVARADGSDARPLLDEPHDHADPSWSPGQRSFAWSPTGDAIALHRNEGGFARLVVVDLTSGTSREISKGWHAALDWGLAGIACIRSGARTPPQLAVIDPVDGARRIVARGAAEGIEQAGVEPKLVDWQGEDGATVHGLLYEPKQSALGTGRPPPMLVDVHGGPTGQAVASWSGDVALLVSRGWAVLRPNPRGSTGYGRPYWRALDGKWGTLDVSDVAAGIRAAGANGWCDPDRVAIAGGSAGGLVVLLVCAWHGSLVRAGVSRYGVTDLFDLAATTHRFESGYLDDLIGTLPEHEDRYRERSPVAHAAAIRVPLLVLQGDADKVVPPAQARLLVDAVRAAGGTVEEHVYEGEGHGWSRPDTVEDALTRTVEFLDLHVVRAPRS